MEFTESGLFFIRASMKLCLKITLGNNSLWCLLLMQASLYLVMTIVKKKFSNSTKKFCKKFKAEYEQTVKIVDFTEKSITFGHQ